MSDEQVAREIVERYERLWGAPSPRGTAQLSCDIEDALQAARREGMEAAAQCCNFYGEEARKIGCPHDAGICDAMGTAIRALPASGDPWCYDMEAAPKGLPTNDAGERSSSEWFWARRKDGAFMQIRRASTYVGHDWEDIETTYYTDIPSKPQWFTAWMPLPTPPRPEGETT